MFPDFKLYRVSYGKKFIAEDSREYRLNTGSSVGTLKEMVSFMVSNMIPSCNLHIYDKINNDFRILRLRNGKIIKEEKLI